MTIHGRSKPVSFRYHATSDGAGIHVTGDAHVNMTDYGINVPSYLGISVKDDVALDASFVVSDS